MLAAQELTEQGQIHVVDSRQLSTGGGLLALQGAKLRDSGMAAAGFGIAIVPDHPVLLCMDLKIIPLTDPDPGRTAYLCRKRGALQPAAAQRFFAFCQAQLSQGAAL